MTLPNSTFSCLPHQQWGNSWTSETRQWVKRPDDLSLIPGPHVAEGQITGCLHACAHAHTHGIGGGVSQSIYQYYLSKQQFLCFHILASIWIGQCALRFQKGGFIILSWHKDIIMVLRMANISGKSKRCPESSFWRGYRLPQLLVVIKILSQAIWL